jgi:hypothetical protein
MTERARSGGRKHAVSSRGFAKQFVAVLLAGLVSGVAAWAQDPVAALEGEVRDPSSGAISGATVTVTNLDTSYSKNQATNSNGFYRLSLLPIGRYSVSIDALGFAHFRQQPVQLNVSQTVRLDVQLELASQRQSITVESDAALVDTATNTLGKVVTTREVLDLPLNGRNFAQLGLLQAGVAPLSNNVMIAGGSLRAGQAYAVQGQRPESNNYLVDGARNVNRMDGGYALRVPVDAIAEFRILTHTASPEYGGTSGSNTRVAVRFATPPPSLVHWPVATSLAQSPWSATPAMTWSPPGLAPTYDMLPHSDDIPARFAVTSTHGPSCSGSVAGAPDGSESGGAVVEVVGGRLSKTSGGLSPRPQPVASSAAHATGAASLRPARTIRLRTT